MGLVIRQAVSLLSGDARLYLFDEVEVGKTDTTVPNGIAGRIKLKAPLRFRCLTKLEEAPDKVELQGVSVADSPSGRRLQRNRFHPALRVPGCPVLGGRAAFSRLEVSVIGECLGDQMTSGMLAAPGGLAGSTDPFNNDNHLVSLYRDLVSHSFADVLALWKTADTQAIMRRLRGFRT